MRLAEARQSLIPFVRTDDQTRNGEDMAGFVILTFFVLAVFHYIHFLCRGPGGSSALNPTKRKATWTRMQTKNSNFVVALD